MDEREPAAANAAGLRFNHVQDQKRGNRRIRRRPADGHDTVPGLGRQGTCRDDHVVLRCHERLSGEACCVLRFRPRLGEGRRHEQKGCQEKNQEHSWTLRLGTPGKRRHLKKDFEKLTKMQPMVRI